MFASRKIFSSTAFAWLVGGCAGGPGVHFGEIHYGLLTIRMPAENGRLSSAGSWLTNNGFALTFEQGLVVEGAKLSLLGLPRRGSGTVAFDPTKPPAGYSVCHAGHCHRADGQLIAYGDIEADLLRSQGGAGNRSVAELNWILGPREALVPGEPAKNLSQASSERPGLDLSSLIGADLELKSLMASGTVAAVPGTAPLPGGDRPWVLNLPQTAAFRGTITEFIERPGPLALEVGGSLELSTDLFDNVNWPLLASGSSGTLDLGESAATARTFGDNLAKSRWLPSIVRRRV